MSVDSAALLDQIRLDLRESERRRTLLKEDPGICSKLGDVIAGEIVPRLMLLHQQQSFPSDGRRPVRPVDLSSHVADFADLLVMHDTDTADAYVRYLMRGGLDLETILVHLLAPAARKLGQLWETDEIDFVDVTIGTSRLHALLHKLTFKPPRMMPDAPDRRLLLVPAPGEQHTFGLVMVAELFQRQGWRVDGGAPVEADDLLSLISQQRFAVIGFSLSCDRLIETLSSSIRAVRRMSKNKSVKIMVGGRIFAQDPSVQPMVGADFIAADAREALELAESAVKSVYR